MQASMSPAGRFPSNADMTSSVPPARAMTPPARPSTPSIRFKALIINNTQPTVAGRANQPSYPFLTQGSREVLHKRTGRHPPSASSIETGRILGIKATSRFTMPDTHDEGLRICSPDKDSPTLIFMTSCPIHLTPALRVPISRPSIFYTLCILCCKQHDIAMNRWNVCFVVLYFPIYIYIYIY